MRKLSFRNQFEEAKAIFINFQYEFSYNHILNKLISLVSIINKQISTIIVGLPPKTPFVDMHLAEKLQKTLAFKGSKCLVLFILQEDKQMLLNEMFKGRGKTFKEVSSIKLNGSISSDTLLYSWGNGKQGKLGISDDYFRDFSDGE